MEVGRQARLEMRSILSIENQCAGCDRHLNGAGLGNQDMRVRRMHHFRNRLKVDIRRLRKRKIVPVTYDGKV